MADNERLASNFEPELPLRTVAEALTYPDDAYVRLRGTLGKSTLRRYRQADGGGSVLYVILTDETGQVELRANEPRPVMSSIIGQMVELVAGDVVEVAGQLRFPRIREEDMAKRGRGDPILTLTSVELVRGVPGVNFGCW